MELASVERGGAAVVSGLPRGEKMESCFWSSHEGSRVQVASSP